MYNKEEEKIIVLDLLRILHDNTDEDHRLCQADINKILDKEYGRPVNRRTVRDNLEKLARYGEREDANEILYEVSQRRLAKKEGEEADPDRGKGLYDFGYVHDFTQGELRLIIDGILFSKHIPSRQKRDLVEKLEGLASKYFNSRIKHISTIDDSGLKGRDLFYNIEILDEAIDRSRQVSFNYYKYNLDENSQLVWEAQLNKDGSRRQYIINPYQIAASNGRYYLICNNDKYDNLSHYRLDRIGDLVLLDSSAKPMDQVKGLESGLDLSQHMAEHIYMYAGESHPVSLRFKKYLFNEFVDWFGTENISFYDETEDEITARVNVNRAAMRRWALQYALHVRVLSPQSLVEEIRADIDQARENYK